ncbi:MAG: hypothetical protein LC713_01220, partial [Actinobacteria bacterium]|nr:hypothetical protein [Actinomycetota bacterium]
WQRGANYTTFLPNAYAEEPSDGALRALRATRTDHIELLTTWFMSDPHASTVSPDAARTPTDASLLYAMLRARELGFAVTLKPHVDVQNGSFRGDIQPGDRRAWYAAYRTMMDHYADLARRGGAEMLVVGTELTSMSTDTAEWRKVIAEARRHFPGRMTFAANWVDGAEKVGFWDALDVIGVDAYMPLAKRPNPSVGELVAGWQPWVRRADALHRRVGKDVLFTEIGYERKDDTASKPSGGAAGPASDAAQARAYWAAYSVWSKRPWFRGIYWWSWPASPPAADDFYAPRGRAAARVISYWNQPAPTL